MSSKPLNPEAEEWRPSPRFVLPHHLYYSSAQPPATTTPAPPPPPQKRAFRFHPLPQFVFRKAGRRFIPPRFRGGPTCRTLPKPPPPPPPPPCKKVWKLKNAGEGGATRVLPSRTTVMIKNIPNRLRSFMLEFLDDCCNVESLEYDFLYLPMDFRKENNLGYAFVNFTSAAAANKFKKLLQNYRWKKIQYDGEEILSKKICEIAWARVQGKAALVRRFQNSNFTCNSLEFLPVVLDPPRNGSDPNPPPPVIIGRLGLQSY